MRKPAIISAIAILSLASCHSDKSPGPADADTADTKPAAPARKDDARPATHASTGAEGPAASEEVEYQTPTAATAVVEREQTVTQQALEQAPAKKADNTEQQTATPNTNTSPTPSYKTEIMIHLQQLDERANQLTVRFEMLRDRFDLSQQQGVHTTPDEECELTNTIYELIDIRNEQIALAKKLGDDQLEHQYFDMAGALYDTKNQLLNTLHK